MIFTVYFDVLRFAKLSKIESIMPSFAKVKLSLKHSNYKLKLHIAWSHTFKRKSKERCETYLNSTQTLFWFDNKTLIDQINKAVDSRLKVISFRHNNKMIRLREQQSKSTKDEQQKIQWQIVHNYSIYALSDEQYEALSFGRYSLTFQLK